VLFPEVFILAKEAMALAISLVGAKITPPGDPGKMIELARVPGSHPLTASQINVHAILDIEAITGGTKQSAGAATETTLADLLPEVMFINITEQGSQGINGKVELLLTRLHLLWQRGIFVTHGNLGGVPTQQNLTTFSSRLDKVTLSRAMQEKVKTTGRAIRTDTTAEAMFIGHTIDTNQKGRFTLGAVNTVSFTLKETVIENLNGVQIARVHAEDNPWYRGFVRLQMNLATEAETKQFLPVGEKKFFRRMDLGRKFQAECGRVFNPIHGHATMFLLHADHFIGRHQRAHEKVYLRPAESTPGGSFCCGAGRRLSCPHLGETSIGILTGQFKLTNEVYFTGRHNSESSPGDYRIQKKRR
jgi:hypothetical protein